MTGAVESDEAHRRGGARRCLATARSCRPRRIAEFGVASFTRADAEGGRHDARHAGGRAPVHRGDGLHAEDDGGPSRRRPQEHPRRHPAGPDPEPGGRAEVHRPDPGDLPGEHADRHHGDRRRAAAAPDAAPASAAARLQHGAARREGVRLRVRDPRPQSARGHPRRRPRHGRLRRLLHDQRHRGDAVDRQHEAHLLGRARRSRHRRPAQAVPHEPDGLRPALHDAPDRRGSRRRRRARHRHDADRRDGLRQGAVRPDASPSRPRRRSATRRPARP